MSSKWRGRLFRYTLALIALGILSLLLLILLVNGGYYGSLPEEADLAKINQSQTTRIFDNRNQVLGKLYLEDRSEISISDISPHVVHTLVAVEDKRFYDHNGIDFRSLGRLTSTCKRFYNSTIAKPRLYRGLLQLWFPEF